MKMIKLIILDNNRIKNRLFLTYAPRSIKDRTLGRINLQFPEAIHNNKPFSNFEFQSFNVSPTVK